MKKFIKSAVLPLAAAFSMAAAPALSAQTAAPAPVDVMASDTRYESLGYMSVPEVRGFMELHYNTDFTAQVPESDRAQYNVCTVGEDIYVNFNKVANLPDNSPHTAIFPFHLIFLTVMENTGHPHPENDDFKLCANLTNTAGVDELRDIARSFNNNSLSQIEFYEGFIRRLSNHTALPLAAASPKAGAYVRG